MPRPEDLPVAEKDRETLSAWRIKLHGDDSPRLDEHEPVKPRTSKSNSVTNGSGRTLAAYRPPER